MPLERGRHQRPIIPPRKRKAVPLQGPAIVTPRSKAAPAIAQRDVRPGNDNRPAAPKSRIVQATKPKGRRKAGVDDGQSPPPERPWSSG
jgi:hypothetical protein